MLWFFSSPLYLNRAFQLSALCSIQGLGSDDLANYFSTMCSHNQSEWVDNFVKFLQSSVVSHYSEQVSGTLIESNSLGGIFQGRRFQTALDGWIHDKVKKLHIFLYARLKADQVLLNCFETLVLSGSRIQGACITTFQAEDLKWGLHQLMNGRGGAQTAGLESNE